MLHLITLFRYRNKLVLKNYAVNLFSGIVPIVAAILTIPIYLKTIGEARYGIVSIVWLFVGYFGILDLGLARATINALARINTRERDIRRGVFWTSVWLNLLIGLTFGLIVGLAGTFLLTRFSALDSAYVGELRRAVPYLAVAAPFILVNGVLAGTIEARERFKVVNSVQVTGALLVQILPLLAALYISPTLDAIIPVVLLSRISTSIVMFTLATRQEDAFPPLPPQKIYALSLLRYGGWVSVSNLISPLLTSLDQIMISSVGGATAVARYSIPMTMATRSQVLIFALSRTLFPRFSRADKDEGRIVLGKTIAFVGPALASVYAPGMLLAQPIISLWLGKSASDETIRIAEIVTLGIWLNSLAILPWGYLQGHGRPDIVTKFHVSEVIPYALGLYIALHFWGVEGAALAWLARICADWSLLSAAAGTLRRSLIPLGLPATIMCITLMIVRTIALSISVRILFAVVIFAVCATYAIWLNRRDST